MKRKLTRRELAVLAAAGAITASAQGPAQSAGEDLTKAAHDLNARNSETLAKFEIPISTEPAFQFRA